VSVEPHSLTRVGRASSARLSARAGMGYFGWPTEHAAYERSRETKP